MGTFVVLVETLVKFSTHIASAFEQIQITTSTFSSIVQLSSLLNAQSRRRDLLHSRERSNQLFQEYLEEHGPAAKACTAPEPDPSLVVSIPRHISLSHRVSTFVAAVAQQTKP